MATVSSPSPTTRTSRSPQPGQKKQEGNEYAAWVIKNKVRQLVGTAGFTASDRDDLEQEMMLDVITRMPKFDENKGTQKTFVARIIERKISTLIRHRTSTVRDYRREKYSLNEEIDDGEGETMKREELVSSEYIDPTAVDCGLNEMDKEALRQALEPIIDGLPAHMREFCNILMTGSVSAAAREMGIPRTTLQDYVTKIRSIFDDAGLREYL